MIQPFSKTELDRDPHVTFAPGGAENTLCVQTVHDRAQGRPDFSWKLCFFIKTRLPKYFSENDEKLCSFDLQIIIS